MRIEGRTALVTGAAGGIGGALVDALLAAGVGPVIACDLDADHLSSVVERAPDRISAHVLDVTDEPAVDAAALAHHDVSILINCHGIVVHESVIEARSVKRFRREMDVNYWGQVNMCRAFAPVLSRAPKSALVNFLSPLAYVTFPFLAPYCATKAACRVLTEAMRAELAEAGTQVMAVFPGTIDTGMMTKLNVPKSPPSVVASAVIAGLRDGREEVWAGESAAEMRSMLKQDPAGLRASAAKQLRVSNLNNAGAPID